MKNLVIATSMLLLSTASVFAQEEVNWAPSLHQVVTATVEASPQLSETEAQAYSQMLSIQVLNQGTVVQNQALMGAVSSISSSNSFGLFSGNVDSVPGLGGFFDSIGIGIGDGTVTCNCDGADDCIGGYFCDKTTACVSAGGSTSDGVCAQS